MTNIGFRTDTVEFARADQAIQHRAPGAAGDGSHIPGSSGNEFFMSIRCSRLTPLRGRFKNAWKPIPADITKSIVSPKPSRSCDGPLHIADG